MTVASQNAKPMKDEPSITVIHRFLFAVLLTNALSQLHGVSVLLEISINNRANLLP